MALLTLGNVGFGFMSIQVIFYYFAFFAFSSRSFFLSKVFQLTCYVIYHNYPGTHYLLSRCGEDVKPVKMVCFVLMTQVDLIYDENRPVDWILSCKAWFPVHLIVFYKRQYLRNLSLYSKN